MTNEISSEKLDLHNTIDQDIEELENGLDDAPDGEETEGKPRVSMRKAINEMCRQCIYDPMDKGAGNWRMQTAACTVIKCPLYPLRPCSKPKKAKVE